MGWWVVHCKSSVDIIPSHTYTTELNQLNYSTYIVSRNKPCHLCAGRQLPINQTLDFTFRPSVVYVNNGQHVPLEYESGYKSCNMQMRPETLDRGCLTFLGWNSYFTQCWKPFPFTFIDVNTRQFPTKWAVYPTPLLVLKLKGRFKLV